MGVFQYSFSARAASDFPILANISSPLTLAIQPACGMLNASHAIEFNTGINLSATRTIVAFGGSWTSNGANGTVPVPPIMSPPSPSADSRVISNGRVSNGFVWVEDLANTLSAKILIRVGWCDRRQFFMEHHDAPQQNGASQRTDFVAETRLFLLQGKYLDSLVPSQMLYTVAFGIK
ncbi:hypothetical protein Hypma_001210 [Hypsizygus marmoreus]|uniref:Uncharacterized protein n=1 Tax=Hypsizygus marmoreus TaxID=39966 RepID=A0A369J8Y7_HYPMA|nr:hypothetical protein Hypma_001210 [Hypsizygus marmoreus]